MASNIPITKLSLMAKSKTIISTNSFSQSTSSRCPGAKSRFTSKKLKNRNQIPSNQIEPTILSTQSHASVPIIVKDMKTVCIF